MVNRHAALHECAARRAVRPAGHEHRHEHEQKAAQAPAAAALPRSGCPAARRAPVPAAALADERGIGRRRGKPSRNASAKVFAPLARRVMASKGFVASAPAASAPPRPFSPSFSFGCAAPLYSARHAVLVRLWLDCTVHWNLDILIAYDNHHDTLFTKREVHGNGVRAERAGDLMCHRRHEPYSTQHDRGHAYRWTIRRENTCH